MMAAPVALAFVFAVSFPVVAVDGQPPTWINVPTGLYYDADHLGDEYGFDTDEGSCWGMVRLWLAHRPGDAATCRPNRTERK